MTFEQALKIKQYMINLYSELPKNIQEIELEEISTIPKLINHCLILLPTWCGGNEKKITKEKLELIKDTLKHGYKFCEKCGFCLDLENGQCKMCVALKEWLEQPEQNKEVEARHYWATKSISNKRIIKGQVILR